MLWNRSSVPIGAAWFMEVSLFAVSGILIGTLGTHPSDDDHVALQIESAVPRGDRARMDAAGLIVFNAPYRVPERVEEALKEFAPILGGGAHTRWLVPDTGN